MAGEVRDALPLTTVCDVLAALTRPEVWTPLETAAEQTRWCM